MKTCSYCGTDNNDESESCNGCGTQRPMPPGENPPQEPRPPAVRTILRLFALGFILFFCWILLIGNWPPQWWERRLERQEALQRIQAAGGWAVLRNDCMLLAETNHFERYSRFGPLIWRGREMMDEMPPAIVKLKPLSVFLYPPKSYNNDLLWPALQKKDDHPEIWVVHIMLSGWPAINHRKPYYGFDVICGTEPESYQPTDSTRRARKVAGGIYEIY
jgi:hypothetical protein